MQPESRCIVASVSSLDKSTYGFCGHKCRMALRGSSAGASLPSSPRFPLQHFCRAKTPQDFSARENQMMARKRTPAYWRMPRTMTQSALICTAEKRVCPCQAKVVSLLDKRTDILSARWLFAAGRPAGHRPKGGGTSFARPDGAAVVPAGRFGVLPACGSYLFQQSSQCCTRPMALSQPRKLRSRTSAVICGVYSLSSVHCSRISSRSCHTPVARPAR